MWPWLCIRNAGRFSYVLDHLIDGILRSHPDGIRLYDKSRSKAPGGRGGSIEQGPDPASTLACLIMSEPHSQAREDGGGDRDRWVPEAH